MKEAQLASKLDAIALEYNHLLTSQLESQRHYFEGLLAQQEEQAVARLAEALQAGSRAEASAREAQQQERDAERRRAAAEKKLVGSLLLWCCALCTAPAGGRRVRQMLCVAMMYLH
jgi:BRCA1-associated protein